MAIISTTWSIATINPARPIAPSGRIKSSPSVVCLCSYYPAERARQVVDAVEARLLTPLGLRSLAPPTRTGYVGHDGGGVAQRDGSYHQGTVWPWLIGAFVDAWLRVRGNSAEAKTEARARFLPPLFEHLEHAGLGHISEIADGDPPHCPAASLPGLVVG